jgi:ZIP family zinc transporter
MSSMCPRLEYYLYRSCCTAVSRKEGVSNTRQQYIPISFSQSEFRCHGMERSSPCVRSLTSFTQLFSALYSMLPSADDYLKKAGLSPQAAAYTLIGCFLGGVVAIQVLSRFLHHHIPSHVVDCDHSHDEGSDLMDSEAPHAHHDHALKGTEARPTSNGSIKSPRNDENTPLLSQSTEDLDSYRPDSSPDSSEPLRPQRPHLLAPQTTRRPSLQTRLSNQVSSLVSRSKSACDEGGPCYGFSSPCGQECFKNIQHRWVDTRKATVPGHRHAKISRAATAPSSGQRLGNVPESDDVESQSESSKISTVSHKAYDHNRSGSSTPSNEEENLDDTKHNSSESHHHHVPQNAFLSIGLQTSIAIALHKLPEGFITFATNHANPKLGFAVFMALFIHNITEGFAMALPLYLALGSRWKAMLWSSLLGGVSQPLGAGVAAIWFKIAGRGDMAPGEGVYGAMFAITCKSSPSKAMAGSDHPQRAS